MEKKIFKFFHLDRLGLLSEGMSILPNKEQLSHFGRYYSQYFNLPLDDLPDYAQREIIAEITRSENEQFSSTCPSRFDSLFAALSVHDAIRFADTIIPVPKNRMRIFEVYATYYFIADMNNLDIDSNDLKIRASHSINYWSAKIYQGAFAKSLPRAPMLEVLLPLPVEVGKVVFEIEHRDGSLIKVDPCSLHE